MTNSWPLRVNSRCGAVDVELRDREAAQIEIEPRESLGGLRRDHGGTGELVRRRVVGEREPVVIDLVAAIPAEREERVTETRRSRA